MEISELEKLKEIIDDAIEGEERRLKKDYENQEHVTFFPGEWVTNGDEVGIVGWVENGLIGIKESDGYFGLDIKNKQGGFKAGCKRNDYQHLSSELISYYEGSKTITINVTGAEIEKFYITGYLGMRNVNPSSLKGKLIDAFDLVRHK